MRKIWYLKQEKGQKTKTAKVFLYEKNGHMEGRMDLSAFNDCEKSGKAPLLLHMKDAAGRDIEKINLESGNVSYEGFFQGKGKLKEELANKLKKIKGEAMLSVTLGKERYLSEGWKDEDIVPEKAGGKSGPEKKTDAMEAGRERGRIEETGGTKEKKRETGNKRENIEEICDKGEETEGAEEKRAEIKETGKDNSETKAGKRKKKNKEAVRAQEELEAEELLTEEKEGKRTVQLSVLEDELLFRSYVHNSFLLHGYYNYGHVVIDESGEEPRLGVPGNYYEREQMVAEMFGFPVFEAAREEEKITNGTFGYFYTKG